MPELGFNDMPQPAAGDAPAGGAPLDLSPAGVNGQAPVAASPQATSTPAPTFGSMLSIVTGQPNYTPPDPQASALDQAAGMLDQRIKRAGSVATNPLAQIFAPEQVAAARDFMPKAAEQLQQIKAQQQHAVDIKQTARNWNLTNPNQFGEQATDTTLANEALRQWKDEGNFNAYKALSGLSPEWKNRADLYMPDAMSKFGDHVAAVQDGIKTLNGAAAVNSEQAFTAARNKVIKDNDLASLGIKADSIPKTIDEWMAKRGSLEAQYNGARRTLNAFNARQDQLNQATPITDEKVAKQVEGTYQFGNGEAIPGFKAVSLPGYGDVQGAMGPPGSRDTANRGITWSNAAPEQIKTVREQLGAEEVKGALSKYKMARDFNTTAQNKDLYKAAAGIALNADELGAIGRDVAEGSKAAGAIGLTKMLESKYGYIDAARNAINREISALKEWRGKPPSERLSPPSIAGIQLVAQFKHDQALKEVQDRIGQPLETAGRYGMQLKNLGIDKELTESPALLATYDNALRQGNKELDSYPMVTIGDRRVLLPTGSNVPGAKVAPLDHGPSPTQPQNGSQVTPLPGQAGIGVQQPAPPSSPTPPGGAGQQSPITIGGAQVAIPAMPAGVSPDFSSKVQRIENPASAGKRSDAGGWLISSAHAEAPNGKSSASGPFQMIDSTWNENKPAGAPARAKDATPEQNAQAFATLTAKNAAALTNLKLPVNDVTLYMAHNVGAGGASALLSTSPTADARTVVGERAAVNNPQFFKGRPTVATVLQRYANAMGTTPEGGVSGTADVKSGPSIMSRAKDLAIDNAPAIGSTVGAIAGGLSPIPGGMFGGGAIGGGLGQSAKDYLQGRPQNPREIAKQSALGGVLGIVPEGRPVVGAAARVLGAGGVEAADEALKTGDVDPLAAGLTGAGYALGGEALGRFVSSAGAGAYKALSRYTASAQRDLSVSAGKLAEARQVLDTEQPKLPGVGDATGAANPKYEAAKKVEEEATAEIKDHGQNPDDMVHAYEQAKAGTSAGEAAVLRKAQSEKTATSQEYEKLKGDVRDTGVGAPRANQPVPDGPLSHLRTAENPTGSVPEQFRPEAEHAEMLIKAPAADWGHKWQQLQNAGTELIEKRLAFIANNDRPSAAAMNGLFEGVRTQQKAVANYVFGKDKGKQVIDRLEDLDQRWAKVMTATQGMDYQKMRSVIQAGNTPERRELEKNFKAFAGDDPSAMRAFNAMKAGAQGRITEEAKLMIPIIAAESLSHVGGIPTLGAVSLLVGGHRLYKVMQEYANAKVLGKAVTFKDFLNNEIKSNGVSQAAGSAAQRGVVQNPDAVNSTGAALNAALP